MNIFKISYKVVRENNDEIYKGFGFKHHSDATQYYVHPNNQSFKGTTTLCQPIGEALVLFSLLCSPASKSDGEAIGDYYVSDDGSQVFLHVNVPDDWRQNGVVEPNIHRYEALIDEDALTIAAYDAMGRWIDGNMEHLHPLYKLLPAFCVLLARECRQDSDYAAMLLNFTDSPVADTFVNLHEDFYQAHKLDEYEVNYSNLSGFDHSELLSFRESFAVIAENKAQYKKESEREIAITAFAEDAFLPEYRYLVPVMPSELVIPKVVRGICSAVTVGDIQAVLFHGPAGTGKTISCKLVCQEIAMPIMDVINCTENLDEFVLGKFIPEEDRIVFKESYVTKAIRFGGAVVFEEINFAKPQYLAFLNSLLDDNGFVRLDNGEVVRRHPNFRFFATMNLGYFGTKELNQALYNRFNVILELAALSDEAVAKMLTTRVPECADKVDKLLGVYHKLKKKIDSEELDLVISPRNLENWVRLAKYEGYLAAAEKTIIPIAKCDRAMEETIRGILVLYKWN
ncbi:MAG: AAA family ATPase [Deltaproteobacteria bacterium]|jgi:MoxR-like ATPase|nr:AAA family ATPase [Deltaproteobacteria bacterium]